MYLQPSYGTIRLPPYHQPPSPEPPFKSGSNDLNFAIQLFKIIISYKKLILPNGNRTCYLLKLDKISLQFQSGDVLSFNEKIGKKKNRKWYWHVHVKVHVIHGIRFEFADGLNFCTICYIAPDNSAIPFSSKMWKKYCKFGAGNTNVTFKTSNIENKSSL